MIVYVLAGRFKRHSRYALIVTAVVVVALAFPLMAGFLEIARESQIEAQIRQVLLTDTVTFERTRLVSATFDWNADPLEARLQVRSSSDISASQVRDLERFLQRRIGRPITLIVDVSRFDSVTDMPAATPGATGASASP